MEERQQLDQSRQSDQRRGRDTAFFPGREQPTGDQKEIDGISGLARTSASAKNGAATAQATS